MTSRRDRRGRWAGGIAGGVPCRRTGVQVPFSWSETPNPAQNSHLRRRALQSHPCHRCEGDRRGLRARRPLSPLRAGGAGPSRLGRSPCRRRGTHANRARRKDPARQRPRGRRPGRAGATAATQWRDRGRRRVPRGPATAGGPRSVVAADGPDAIDRTDANRTRRSASRHGRPTASAWSRRAGRLPPQRSS